ncbi:MAG: hypothetical protein MUP17_04825, partial [candidate division Zixibacteria bacterium]|nr:hypothetical protein [candidate division Zixibacteria bacterium]
MYKKDKLILISIFFIFLSSLILSLSSALARTKNTEVISVPSFTLQKPQAGEACVQLRTHRVAKYCFPLTNWGFIGSQARRQQESQGGCFNPNPAQDLPAPSFEYPCGSDLDYLFQGALWVGAVVEGETLVSVGADGWLGVYEMFPATEDQGGCIKEKSIRPSTPNCNPPDTAGAISEQDIIATYSDTATVGINPDDYDRRPHKPIGIQIEQKSYSWSYDYAEDLALIDFTIRNIGQKNVKNIWMGLYVDADVYHISKGAPGSFDDITGYRFTYPSPLWGDTMQYQDTIQIGWIADNDGDLGKGGVVTDKSITGLTGTRVVRAPTEKISFNWWLSEGNDPVNLDWGPQKQDNWDLWIKNYGSWCEGGKGTPCGDRAKYYTMSNDEFDYDQIYACINKSDSGWLPPPGFCTDLADGYDTRYLFSFGPISVLAPDESKKITISYVAAENFHYKVNPMDVDNPLTYYRNLDFSDFATNARWAGWVYDNPGVDTPDPATGQGDGNRGKCFIDPVGDTCLFYYEGDGVPDFKGPPPPNPPSLVFDNGKGYIKVKWNGKSTEEGRDPFTGARDFEGYRIYMSETGQPNDWTLLASYDYVNYKMYKLRPKLPTGHIVEWLDEGIRPCDIKRCFGDIPGDSLVRILGRNPNSYTEFHPWVYPGPDTLKCNWYQIAPGDSLFFALQDWNKGTRDLRSKVSKAYADSVDQGCIPLTEIRDDYYECEFMQEGLLPSFPVWIAVTAFDFGNARTNLGGLEASKGINAKQVFPLDSPAKAQALGEKVVVVPNPYKISENYQNPQGLESGSGQ